MENKEFWAKIEGWDNYSVSSFGRVRNDNTMHIIRNKPTAAGYEKVTLWAHNKPKWFFVHRLVAKAFIPKVEGKESVDHINGVRNDNRAENLRWCNQWENVHYPLAIEHYNNRGFEGEGNPFFGKHHSEGTKEVLSKKATERLLANNPFKGKHHTEQTKALISAANKGRPSPLKGTTMSAEARKRMSENHADVRGEKHPMWNRHHTEEARKIMAEKRRGRRTYNNGVKEISILPGDEIPQGFVLGGLPKPHDGKRVGMFDKEGTLLKEFQTIKDAALYMGSAKRAGNIVSACRGALLTAYGYKWKYL